MKVANNKVNVPQTSELNDKDQMNRCLTSLKELSKNYTVALTEASNETLYKKYFEAFKKISQMQREVYELMFTYGWYELQTADKKEIENTYKTLLNEYNSLCN